MAKNDVQETKAAKKAIKKFHSIFALLREMMGHNLDEDEIELLKDTYGADILRDKGVSMKQALYNDAVYIEETLRELAIDKKIEHVRLIKRWEAKQKIKEENEKLDKEREEYTRRSR